MKRQSLQPFDKSLCISEDHFPPRVQMSELRQMKNRLEIEMCEVIVRGTCLCIVCVNVQSSDTSHMSDDGLHGKVELSLLRHNREAEREAGQSREGRTIEFPHVTSQTKIEIEGVEMRKTAERKHLRQ